MTFIFISDLDGTLLGQRDFDFGLIKSDIINLLDSGHLLVLASSKTKVEIEGFCDELGRSLPFIYENGAGVENFCLIGGCEAPPNSHQNPKAIRTDALLTVWERYISFGLKSRCHFVKDMDRSDQQTLLGLGTTALDRAMKRSFSLPFTFSGPASDVQKLKHLATKAGLSIQQGGRVYNLSGCHDKADYLPDIRKWASTSPVKPCTLLIGTLSLSPDISRVACCDRGYDGPSGRPWVSAPATYRSGTPRIQLPAVARWHSHLHGLATAIHETSGLAVKVLRHC